ncbi:MAG: hypothetical protein GY834_10055, partial [Bacteroidetes bacterium]|nr:hypothetical protein [Bacteroidota bacterium]
MKKNNLLTTLILTLTFFISINSYSQCEYLDTSGIDDLQDSLATYFPSICKKIKIGTSVSGYDLVAMKFSDNVNIDEAEPEILLTSCIHGDETHPEQVMMKLARELCLKYNYDPQIT